MPWRISSKNRRLVSTEDLFHECLGNCESFRLDSQRSVETAPHPGGRTDQSFISSITYSVIRLIVSLETDAP